MQQLASVTEDGFPPQRVVLHGGPEMATTVAHVNALYSNERKQGVSKALVLAVQRHDTEFVRFMVRVAQDYSSLCYRHLSGSTVIYGRAD